MKLGIVGLPNVGKSTLFNSLTKAGAESANYPFCTIDPNVGIVTVPDERLNLLADLYHSAKVTPAVIEFVDIAGLVKGASKGEGLGNQFLANIREVDAIVHVVRCFEDTNVIHVDGSVDPTRDIDTINLELIFSDIEILERRIAKSSRGARNDKKLAKEVDFLQRLKAYLEEGNLAIGFELQDEDEEAWFAEYNLLTAKPVIYAANVSEAHPSDGSSAACVPVPDHTAVFPKDHVANPGQNFQVPRILSEIACRHPRLPWKQRAVSKLRPPDKQAVREFQVSHETVR